MNSRNSYYKDCCRLCSSKNLTKVVELTPTPPGNYFVKQEDYDVEQECFPLELFFCNDCSHIQLGHVVDPTYLFQNNYSYVSSTSKVFLKHLSDYADYISEYACLNKDSFVVDIGSNDGACLSFFKKKGFKVLGVDPAKEIAETANKKGIYTISDFFSADLASEIKEKHGPPNLITSHNACAHINDLRGVISGVEKLLSDDGLFVMEVGYFRDVFENLWFDTIYHEHLDFHTVTPLISFFNSFNMDVVRVERIEPQGGSIRVFVKKKKETNKVHDSVLKLVKQEEDIGLNDPTKISLFNERINKLKHDFKDIIVNLKKQGYSIAAFGASTKATTLCYHFDINKEDIEFIVDENPLKQNLLSPGKKIPVFPLKTLYERMPDFTIILAWNFAKSIMKNNLKYTKSGKSFILPMPVPRILKNNE